MKKTTTLNTTAEVKAMTRAMSDAGIRTEVTSETVIGTHASKGECFRSMKKGSADAWITRAAVDLFVPQVVRASDLLG
jgi:hypothetical protein|tara:strand:+ start:1145 stop:1378 length:234 start_codon:yes stop_codon:yes gene_type:complete